MPRTPRRPGPGGSEPGREQRIRGLLDRAWSAVDRGDRRGLGIALAQLRGLDRDLPEVASLDWRAAEWDEQYEAGLARVDAALRACPGEPDLLFGQGRLRAAAGDLAGARKSLEAATAADPEDADAWYELALVREDLGDEKGKRSAFARVWDLDARDATPLRLPRARFDTLVEEALDLLPEEVRSAMPDVAVIVEDRPDRWIVDDAPWDPRLLGLFSGADYARARSSGPVHDPATIHLFQRNIERACLLDREVVEQVRITVLHEVGHWLGLDEGDLHERGLD